MIEPLDVVDREQRRLGAQQRQQPERDRALVQRLARLGAQQSHLERVTLRAGQPLELRLRDVEEQVAERRVRQLGLGLDRPARQARCRDRDTASCHSAVLSTPSSPSSSSAAGPCSIAASNPAIRSSSASRPTIIPPKYSP
jgi:hypothetical protein